MIRILVADDDKFIRLLLKKILKKHNCLLETVESGSEVLRKMIKQKFNLLFLDIHMGGMSGLESIPLIKEIDPDLPIIVMTADPSVELENKTRSLGVYKYFRKPLDLSRIEKIVSQLST